MANCTNSDGEQITTSMKIVNGGHVAVTTVCELENSTNATTSNRASAVKPLLDSLVNQLNELRSQIDAIQAQVDSGGGGLTTDFAGQDIHMNATGTGGTFHLDDGRIAFKNALGTGADGYIQTGSGGDGGGIGLICHIGHELKWENGFLTMQGPAYQGTGVIILGDVAIFRGTPQGEGPRILTIDGGTLQIEDIPIYADNLSAVAELPLGSLYTTPTGEVRAVMGV